MEGTRLFDHEPCLMGEGGVIGDALELEQEQGKNTRWENKSV